MAAAPFVFRLPPSRVHLLPDDGKGKGDGKDRDKDKGRGKDEDLLQGGAAGRKRRRSVSSSPSRRPSITRLRAPKRRAADAPADFFLADAAGLPQHDAHGACITFSAAKPAVAAAKAFRAFMRSASGKAAAARFLAAWEGSATRTAEPPSVRAALAAAVSSGAVTRAEADAYRSAYAADAPLFHIVVDVVLGRVGKASLRRYTVTYVPVKRPNTHEIRKRICRTVRALYVPKTATPPPSHATAVIA